MSSGVIISDEFINSDEARQYIIDFTRKVVGPRIDPSTQRREKPDLDFAIAVINRTIPVGVLVNEKKKKFIRAMDIIIKLHGEMEKIRDAFIGGDEKPQEIIDFISELVGPRVRIGSNQYMKPDLIFAASVMKNTVNVKAFRHAKREEFERALDVLFSIRDELSLVETIVGMFWPIDED